MWRYLVADLHDVVPAPWLQIALILVSAISGGVVGAEREKREKPAGLRTLILVCVGSTAFTLVGYAFTSSTGDSGRVAAQIVAGVGFLGAGAIMHGPGFVRGITTAAVIWVTAATGMIVGTGYAGAGLGLSLLVRLLLTGIYMWESRHFGEMRNAIINLVCQPNNGKTRAGVEKIMEEFGVREWESLVQPDGLGHFRACLKCRLPRRLRREFLYELSVLPGVLELHEKDEAVTPAAPPEK
jgi:putative Mg2+ transporter-C (MgtC) family protein